VVVGYGDDVVYGIEAMDNRRLGTSACGLQDSGSVQQRISGQEGSVER